MISKKHVIILMMSILMIGSIVRFWNMTNKGLFFWDEGLFLMGTRFVNWRTSELTENFGRFGFKLSSFNSDHESFEGYPVFLQKPGHIALLSVASLVWGVDEYLGHVVSSVFGLLSIVLVYFIGRICGGQRLGLLAALLLALGPTHVHYSRVGLHEITSSFFVLMAVLFHLKSMRRSQSKGLDEILFFLTGICLSYAIICSYRWIIFIPVFIGMDILILSLRGTRLPVAIWRALLFMSGFMIPLSFAEFFYFLYFYPDYVRFQPSSYFNVLLYKFSSETHFNMSRPFHYLGQLSKSEGVLYLSLVVFGLLHSIRKKHKLLIYITLLLLFPFILYSFNVTRVARAISIVVPFMAILAATTIISVHNLLKKMTRHWRVTGNLMFIIILVVFIRQDITILGMNSGYDAAFDFVMQRSDGKHLSTMAPIGALRMGRESVPLHPPRQFEELQTFCEHHGYRYILVDWQKYVWYYPSIEELERNYEPVIIIPNPYVNVMSVLNENYIPGLLEALCDHDKTLDVIKIYDLNQIFNIPVPIHTIMVRNMREK